MRQYEARSDLAITGHLLLIEGEVDGSKQYYLRNTELHTQTPQVVKVTDTKTLVSTHSQ